jgi:hypothetical protein
MSEALVREYYSCFNERRFSDAIRLFAANAVLEFGDSLRGSEAHVEFAERWVRAFPDARLVIEHVEQRGDVICEVDIRALGTHLGALDLGAHLFKPSGAATELRMRQLFEVRLGHITFSSLSFDLQDFIQQLAPLNYTALKVHLDHISRLSSELADVRDDAVRQKIAEQIGAELDGARRVLRPYFYR